MITREVASTGWDALASDGSVVRIRPIRPDDEQALSDLNHRVSERTIYLRFFGISRLAADEHTHHLAAADPLHGFVALVAEVDGAVVGVASYEPMRADEAEMAFLLDDAVHGRGIGTLLLEQLAAVARERGIRHLHADTLAENAPMLRVFLNSGFTEVHELDSGVVELSIDTEYTPGTLDRMAERERAAEDRSLQPLLAPRSVAVIGAGREPGGIGHEVLANLVDGQFNGLLFAVDPPADRIGDIASYPSIADVPGPVDLAVIAVPAVAVAAVLAECGAAGVRGATILTSAFSELGADGPPAREELLAIARRHSLRLIGPDCLGIVNTAPEVRLDATFANIRPSAGSLALAAQSGAVGIAVLDQAGRAGLGISEFVSLGDKVDVSGNDLLLHWWQDPRTDVIGLYLESFGNPRKFSRLARLVGRTKPVLVVKGGRSTSGRRASHTAGPVMPDTAVDALFEQSGVLRMETLEELVDTARVLSGRPLPRGNRLAVVGNAGGAGVLAADAACALDIDVPEFSAATTQELTEVGAGNPVDLGAAATAATIERALRIVIGSGEADAVLVTYAATRAGDVEDIYAAIARAAEGSAIPILVNCLGAPDAAPVIALADGSRLPVFSFPETAVRALGHAIRYAAWRSRPQGIVPALSGVDLDGARTIVRQYLAAHSDGGRLDPSRTAELMRCAGISVALATAGIELVAGMVRDPLFGPVLMVGSGGVLADLLADRRWRGLPLTDLDAAEMVRSLRCAPLLAGYRGAAGADEPAVLDVLHRIAWLAEAVPELSELDINPLIATPAGAFAVDVNLRLAPAAPERDWYGRRLQGHLTGDRA